MGKFEIFAHPTHRHEEETKQAKQGESFHRMGKHNFRKMKKKILPCFVSVYKPEKKQETWPGGDDDRLQKIHNMMFHTHYTSLSLPLTSIACCFSLPFLLIFFGFFGVCSLGEGKYFSVEKIFHESEERRKSEISDLFLKTYIYIKRIFSPSRRPRKKNEKAYTESRRSRATKEKKCRKN